MESGEILQASATLLGLIFVLVPFLDNGRKRRVKELRLLSYATGLLLATSCIMTLLPEMFVEPQAYRDIGRRLAATALIMGLSLTFLLAAILLYPNAIAPRRNVRSKARKLEKQPDGILPPGGATPDHSNDLDGGDSP